ncbi:MAG: ABC transporter substrate-binding protein [Acidimicrobiales bacterium]
MIRHRRRIYAAGLAFLLIAAGCGSDDSEESATTKAAGAQGATTTAAAGATGGKSDGVLKIGELLPQTGSLAFLGPPEFAGAKLAKQEIDAAGGVLGKPLELLEGDSGDTSTDTANQTVDRHLAAGADVILGAASSGVTKTVIKKVTQANVIQFSPANTSPEFTTYEDNGLYFRTAPSDILQGRVLSDLLLEDKAKSVGLIARQDSYGENLAKFTEEPLKAAGVTVSKVLYDEKAQTFDAEVDKLVGANPDGIVVIGFDESAKILTSMFQKGLTQDKKKIYLVDGNIGNSLGEKFTNPTALKGIKGTLPSAELKAEFKDRLLKVDPALKDFSYSAETYDAVLITALAAEVAKSDNPVLVAKQINGVTKTGDKCTTYKQCLDLVKAGKDIDYDGIGGPYEFGDAGEPNSASFAIQQYGDGNKIDDSLTKYRFAKL